MKKIALALVLAAGLALPRQSQAREVTFVTKLRQFGGYSAYVALFLVDPHGKYVKTIWMAGGHRYYYRHMGGWLRASRGDLRGLDGITGASVGAGRTLTVRTNLADSLIDAGYEVQIDAVSEGMPDSPADVRMKLKSQDSGLVVHGRGYVADFSYKM